MKKGLGRGLEALLGDDAIDSINNNNGSKQNGEKISLNKIIANKEQPRKNFPKDELEELATSIKNYGILQPILVQKIRDDKYMIIAGERRFRAAQIAGLTEIDVIIKNFSDEEIAQIALVENLQRSDLSPIEEAEAYENLQQKFGYSPEFIGEKLGKSRSHITNILRLLQLPNEVKSLLREKKISFGHARALIGNKDAVKLANQIISENISVREIEKKVKAISKPNSSTNKGTNIDPDLDDYSERIAAKLGLVLEIKKDKNGQSGYIKINYQSIDQLNMVGDKLLQ